MRAVSPHDFARHLRRHERRRTIPFFVGPPIALLACGALVTWSLDWGQMLGFAIVGLLTGGVAVGYLAHYLHDLAHGRTIHPIAGTITLASSTITIAAKHRATTFSLADVAHARVITSGGFDDLKDLLDVLELSLVSGPTLRIPASFTGFDALERALPRIQVVDLDND